MQTINPIIIVAYRPEWPEEFGAIAHALQEVLGEKVLRIDHIGSTAVPGLAAKDVIDVQVTVQDFTPDLEAAFGSADYSRLEYTHGHLPPTATGSKRDWEKRMSALLLVRAAPICTSAGLGARMGAMPSSSATTCAHPLASVAYEQAKMALAQHGPTDYDLYYDVKDPVCDIIMAGAEDWATATGWRIEHYS